MTYRRLYTYIDSPGCGWPCASSGFHLLQMAFRRLYTWMALPQCVLADVFLDLQIRWRTCCTVRIWKVFLQSGISCASTNERRLQMICHTGHTCARFPFCGLAWSWPKTLSGQTHNDNWLKLLQNRFLNHHFPFLLLLLSTTTRTTITFTFIVSTWL